MKTLRDRRARRSPVPSDRAPSDARPPDRLLVLVGFEPEQLHLDVVAGLEFELSRGKRRAILAGRPDRRELADHPFVARDERVDEELIGPRLEFEMLEGVDVEGDRQRGE